jgi:hypothetical protein
MRTSNVIVDDTNVIIVELPANWSGRVGSRSVPGGTGVINIWTSARYNHRKIEFSLYAYPDGTLRGRGIQKYKALALKALEAYKGGGSK